VASSGLAVTFNSLTPGVCTLSGSTVTIVHSGRCTIEATQAGTANYSAAPPVDRSFSINSGPAVLWIGLRSSDDQGAQFDIRVEVYNANTLVASGESRCITGVTRNPSLATQVSVPLSGSSNGSATVKLFTRIGTNADNTRCSGGGSHANATGLALYYDAVSRPSVIGDTPLYLRTTGTSDFLSTTAPTTTTAKEKDSGGINFATSCTIGPLCPAGKNPWVQIGTGWSD
jgi:hypothetical protein